MNDLGVRVELDKGEIVMESNDPLYGRLLHTGTMVLNLLGSIVGTAPGP